MDVVVCRWDRQLVELLAQRCRVHLVLDAQDRPDPATDGALLAGLPSVYRLDDLGRAEELAAVAVDLRLRGVRPARVVSFMETSQFAAGLLGDLLGVGTAGVLAATVVRDKRAMKQRVAEAGIPCAPFVSLGQARSAPSVEEIVDRIGLPCVIKPVAGMGCSATRVLRDRAALAGALAAWADGGTGSPGAGQLMIERFVAGEEVHVDAVWRDGTAWAFCVSRYLVPVLQVGTAGRQNGSHALREADEPELYATLLALHTRVNAALGISHGITHAEFLLGPDGPVFSELGARFGGAAVPESVGHALGTDLRTLFVEELTGQAAPSRPPVPGDRTVGWLTLAPPRSGILTDVTATVRALRAEPDVLHVRAVRQDGNFVDAETNPPDAAVAFVVLEAADPAAFRRRAAEIEQRWPLGVVRAPDGGGVGSAPEGGRPAPAYHRVPVAVPGAGT